MPSKTYRKLNLVGKKSVGVVLPIEWLRYNRLQPTDEVEVFFDDVVIVIPPNVASNDQKVRRSLQDFLEDMDRYSQSNHRRRR